MKFIILLHKVLYGYVTLFDVYEWAINSHKLEAKIAEARAVLCHADYLPIDDVVYVAHRELNSFCWERIERTNWMKAPATEELQRFLDERNCLRHADGGSPWDSFEDPDFDDRRQRFEAVKRWFNDDWKRIEPKLRTSIVEGISVFLSLFDDNPAVKRTFCPPKECYDSVANQDGRYGIPLPPFSELIEQGKVLP